MNNMDQSKATIIAFLDITKAFDSVDHRLLVDALDNCGIRGKLLDLIKSFLINRTQSVQINGTVSNPLPIRTGTPQGSVLGPTLFLIY